MRDHEGCLWQGWINETRCLEAWQLGFYQTILWFSEWWRKSEKWGNQVFLAKSIADIQAHDKDVTFQKKASDSSALVLLAADDREKVTSKNGNMPKITNKEIFTILLEPPKHA